MPPFTLNSPGEIQTAIGRRARQLRLDLGLTQAELAERAGMAVRTLKTFEQTGKASLEHVVRLAFALGAEPEFDALFPRRPFRTIADVLADNVNRRQRVRRKKLLPENT
jgi:transcriptional regulator with XRE-family HTH domain